eukprot:448493-Pleurochrysis_carterae.AAC.1
MSAMWALAKANIFWVLHAGRHCLPGALTATARFATYKTNATVLGARRGSTPAHYFPARHAAHNVPPNGTDAVASPPRSTPTKTE